MQQTGNELLQRAPQSAWAILDLRVNNHPGVMCHVCGLFARRAFNVEKILCLPLQGGAQSRILLTVKHDHRLDQLVSQLEKLEDVREVRRRAGAEEDIFRRIEDMLRRNSQG